MKKPTKPKKRNMQDATLINVRAVNKRVKKLEGEVALMWTGLNAVSIDLAKLEAKVKKLEAKKK